MPLTQEHAEVTVDSVLHLLSRPNIHAVDVLPKTVRGERTDELAVVVTVNRKKRPHHFDDDDYPIPKAIEVPVVGAGGRRTTELVRTDVVEAPPVRRAALDEKVRPTEGGYQITIFGDWFEEPSGTLGVNMQYRARLCILTNNHVIANNGNIGSNVYQPDLFGIDNKVGEVAGYIPIRSYNNPKQQDPEFNKYDFVWAYISPGLAALTIKGIGQPTGDRAPVLGERVRWIGKTTGTVQQATITSITKAIKDRAGQGRWAWFNSLITLDGVVRNQPPGEVRHGDSGSALVADDMTIVGFVTWKAKDSFQGTATRFPGH